MKIFFLTFFAAAVIGCSNNPTTYTAREMVVSPKSLTFASGVSVQHLSITHTCTCPFQWHTDPLGLSPVFIQSNGAGDSTNAWIGIDRSKLTTDTLHTFLQVT